MTKPKILLKTSYNHDVLLSNNKYDLKPKQKLHLSSLLSGLKLWKVQRTGVNRNSKSYFTYHGMIPTVFDLYKILRNSLN